MASLPAPEVTVVVRITKEGYGDEEGQIPKQYKNHIEAFKTKKHYSKYRCGRELFVPFTTGGFIKKEPGVVLPRNRQHERVDGLRTPSNTFPIYLFMHFRSARLVGTAIVQKRSKDMVKLVFLCAAPAARGTGKALLEEVQKQSRYFPNKPTYAKLNDDSGQPGYYSKRGWTRQPKSVQYGTKSQPKKLKVYKRHLQPKSISAIIPSYSGFSYENIPTTTPSLVLLQSPSPSPVIRKRIKFVRSPYQLRHRYALRPRR